MSKELTKEDLFNMKLHERYQLDINTEILRVFGGWIYTFLHLHTNEENTAVFVPEVVNVECKQI